MADPTAPTNRPHDRSPFPRLRLTEPSPESCEDLAEMFLGERAIAPHKPAPTLTTRGAASDPADRDQPRLTRRALAPRRVEAVVLGHLPVLPSAWVGVYAHHRASVSGRAVALTQLRPDRATIEWCDRSSEPSPSACASLDLAIERAANADWLVRLPELAEPSLAQLSGLTHLTILTGSDEAAVVATYRVLKALASTLSSATTGASAPRLSVAVLGGPGARGRATAAAGAERIGATANAFLELEPDIEIFQGRIEPRARHTLFNGPAPTAQEVLDRITSTRDTALDDRKAANAHVAEPKGPGLLDGVQADLNESIAPPILSVATAAEASSSTDVPAAIDRPTPEWAARIEGLEPLGLECPYAPSVELAKDPVGRLHLLAEAMDAQGRPTPPGDAAASLLNAAAWAHDHRRLLAFKDERLESWLTEADSTALHLIVTDARDARPLLDTSLTLHLAVRAHAGEANTGPRDGMILVDLNNPV
ncbi:MAG: hypothetical protein AAGK04_10515 [Planctomycetota bacterium]